MPAKDYQVCCGWRNAYIAKTSKRESGLMLSDRREITESEILMLIHWWATRKSEEKKVTSHNITIGDDVVVEIELKKPMEP